MPRFLLLAVLCLLACAPALPAVHAQDRPSIAEKTDGFTRMEGFFTLYWDEAGGQVWMEIDRFDEAFLYATSLPAGLGSNDIGLDRNQLSGEHVVHFERVGPKVLLVEPNLRYRAVSDNAAERASVRDAFAESVVWGFTAAAETDGRVLVDATPFIVRDAHGVERTLRGSGQGTFRLDPNRSTPYLPRTRAFPDNTEMEARLTFTTDSPGGYVRSVAPDPYAVTLRERHSFIRLPDDGYEPRAMDPRSGYFGVSYVDYATPIGEEKEKRFINRHRLQCAGSRGADGLCDPAEPIVYYLDAGTPEPVRSALLEGASWWNQAFEAAGFRDGFRVAVLPDSADPMDVRYNMINWVHRSTRGWSYGSSISDPRTGEIIKGHVLLGSLRVRQDYLIAEGLLAPYVDSLAAGFAPQDDPMLRMALARIRQLSAHEVGHTLGLAHNFGASVNDRASVMDYPAPLVTAAADGGADLSRAYDTDIGEWDKAAIRYGYAEFPAGADEHRELEAILAQARADGLYYLTDTDARPPGAAHPLANLWDNGSDVLEAFRNTMAVREQALERFGMNTIREGRPLATLEEVLVPLYLGHRYQVDAAVKLLGGVEYTYTLRGDAQPLPQAVPATLQRAALEALLGALTPEALSLPPNIRTQLPPRPPGYGPHRELFDGYTGLTFDPYVPAEVAAAMVLGLLIHPERAARLVYQSDFDEQQPGLRDVMVEVSRVVWEERIPDDDYYAEIQRIVQQVWADALLDLAQRSNLAPAVRAAAVQHLREVHAWIEENPGARRDYRTIAHRNQVFDQIDRYLFRFYRPDEEVQSPDLPPGSPIGDEAASFRIRQQRRQDVLGRWEELYRACSFMGF